MSGWDLSGAPDGLIVRLARELEAEWMRLPNLRDAPCAPELKSVDAVAPDGDPATRIRIENLCLQTDAFRKMHLEVAWGLGGLEVLHCVVYAWAEVPCPIFAADLVAFNGRVTLCIADASPTAMDLSLPDAYIDAAASLREEMLTRCPAMEPRPLPEWGRAILSPEVCVCVGPPKEDGEQRQAEAFCGYARGLHAAHVALADRARRSADRFGGSPDEYGGGSADRLAAQARFCEKQLLNDKTRRVLERSMGEALTERYMTEVLFDVTPDTPLGPDRA